MSEYDEFENFIVFDCANLISRNRVHSNIDNFAPQYIRDATKGVREMGYDSVALLKNSAFALSPEVFVPAIYPSTVVAFIK